MKLQKARNILHQHRVAEVDLQQTQVKLTHWQGEQARLNEQPETWRITVKNRQLQLTELQTRIKQIEEEVVDLQAKLAQPVDGLQEAQNCVISYSRMVEDQKKIVARYAKDLEEAKATVTEIEKKEAERKAKEDPGQLAEQKKLDKRNKDLREGKTALRQNIDPMGNEALGQSKCSIPSSEH